MTGVGMERSYLIFQMDENVNLCIQHRQMYWPLVSSLECPLSSSIIILHLNSDTGMQDMDSTSQSQQDV